MDNFTLQINTEALNQIISCLAKSPYNEVANLIEMLKAQAIHQIEEHNKRVKLAEESQSMQVEVL